VQFKYACSVFPYHIKEMSTTELDRLLNKIDYANVEVRNAVLRCEGVIKKIRSEGVDKFNSCELVSVLMKTLTKVRSISGQEKKEIVIKVIDELLVGNTDAELIRSMAPVMIDHFCILIRKRDGLYRLALGVFGCMKSVS